MQIPELLAQLKIIFAKCDAHPNAHKQPKTVAPTVLMLTNTYRWTEKKSCHAHFNAHKPPTNLKKL